jgi:hypothetical protein
MSKILFWNSNDIAYQGPWSYAGILEAALEVAVNYLEEAGMSDAIDEINRTLDEDNEHAYTPKDKGGGGEKLPTFEDVRGILAEEGEEG